MLLRLRVATAVLGIPVMLAALYYGGPFFGHCVVCDRAGGLFGERGALWNQVSP